jgi:serine/threonine protein kinase
MASRVFETATNTYITKASIGDGGCGTVYQVTDSDGEVFAVKLLREAASVKRKRFKNELAFCRRNKHERIVSVLDEGVCLDGAKRLPFYVMPLYDSTLRKLMDTGIPQHEVLRLFNDVLDGVEAAHLQNVVHRDLKPENLLVSLPGRRVVVADFGVAHFEEEDLLTAVQTRAGDRLANYRYSAPEQRVPGRQVDERADIFALGLILNEMFTGEVPQGTGHKRVGSVAPDYAYLDPVIEAMIQQSPGNRPPSIAKIKEELIGRGNEFVAKQRLDQARKVVVPETTPDDPLGGEDIRVVSADYSAGSLICQLSAAPPPEWIVALQNPKHSYSSVMGDASPHSVQISGPKAVLAARATTAADTARNLKDWVSHANGQYRQELRRKTEEKRQREIDRIKKGIQRAEDDAKAAEALRSISFT